MYGFPLNFTDLSLVIGLLIWFHCLSLQMMMGWTPCAVHSSHYLLKVNSQARQDAFHEDSQSIL